MPDDFMTGYVAGQSESNNNGGGGFGMWGDQWIWIIVVFALLFGWGNNGWGGSGNGGNGSMSFLPYAVGANGALTRGDLCSEFSFNDLQNGVRGVSDSLNVGFANLNSTICHQQYDTAALVNGLSNTVQQGFYSANTVALQNQNALQAQLANCCCQTQRAIDGINYNMATNTCALQTSMANNTRDIIDSQNAGTRAILDYLCQEKIADLQSENQSLKLAASQANQNIALGAMMEANTAEILRKTAPTPVPAYAVNPPFPYFGYGFGYGQYNGNNGCCGCGAA